MYTHLKALDICSGWAVNTSSFTCVGGGLGRVWAGRCAFTSTEEEQNLNLTHIQHIRHVLGIPTTEYHPIIFPHAQFTLHSSCTLPVQNLPIHALRPGQYIQHMQSFSGSRAHHQCSATALKCHLMQWQICIGLNSKWRDKKKDMLWKTCCASWRALLPACSIVTTSGNASGMWAIQRVTTAAITHNYLTLSQRCMACTIWPVKHMHSTSNYCTHTYSECSHLLSHRWLPYAHTPPLQAS